MGAIQAGKGMALTFDFFKEQGLSADIAWLRTANPQLTTFQM
jgi:hypothetical protein